MRNESREPGEPVKRLFFALPCAQAQRRAIAQWRGALHVDSGRPVPVDNFHVTLLFLGAVAVTQVPALCAAAATVARAGQHLTVPLDRLEVWRQSRVLLLTSVQTPLLLRQLVYALREAMLPLGFTELPKDFRPHLTLMRDYRTAVPESSAPPDFHLNTGHFTLFESHKGQYRPVGEWRLGG